VKVERVLKCLNKAVAVNSDASEVLCRRSFQRRLVKCDGVGSEVFSGLAIAGVVRLLIPHTIYPLR